MINNDNEILNEDLLKNPFLRFQKRDLKNERKVALYCFNTRYTTEDNVKIFLKEHKEIKHIFYFKSINVKNTCECDFKDINILFNNSFYVVLSPCPLTYDQLFNCYWRYFHYEADID